LTSIVLFTLGAYGVAAGAATGQQAVVAVGIFAFAVFACGIVWPIASLARIGVDVVAPPDAMVGDTVELRVTLTGHAPRVEVRLLDPVGGFWCTAAPATGVIPHVAARRGVFHFVRVQLRTSAPLGVFVRTRTLRVELPAPVMVAPRPSPARAVLDGIPEERISTVAPILVRAGGDTVRAVRPYVPGDPARLVHWPTSARRGELVVREQEPPAALGVALVVDLRGSEPEATASRAAGVGIATLAAGGVVWLGTHAGGVPSGELVGDARSLGRVLARATAGPPAEPPEGWTKRVVSG
jgi:uncharacterized protein (DUF58 family)